MEQLFQEDKTRKFFLFGSATLLTLIVGGLAWVIFAEPGRGGDTIDPNTNFYDEGNPTIGPADAKVTVRIYSDFQCPACQYAEVALNPIIEQYRDRVRFIWNDYPLTQLHPNATLAAMAARCAAEQGYFWEYHHQLYAMQDEWKNLKSPKSTFEGYATELDLQLEPFQSCLVNEKSLMAVQGDLQEALQMQLESTPTFFVNRKMILGAISGDQWKEELDAALAEQ